MIIGLPALNMPILLVDIRLSAYDILGIQFIMIESVIRTLLNLRGYQLRERVSYKSIPGFRNLAGTLSLIDVELIYLRLVL